MNLSIKKLVKSILNKYYLLVSLALLLIITSKIDWAAVGRLLPKINYALIAFGLILALPNIFIKSWRWNYLKKQQGINYEISDSFKIYAAALGFGTITPGRIAEVIKIYYLKEQGYKISQSLVSVIMDRVFDLTFLVILTLIGLVFFFRQFWQKNQSDWVIGAALALFITVTLKYSWHKKLAKKAYQKIIPQKYQEKWSLSLNDFLNGWRSYRAKTYLVGLIFTCLSWIIYYLEIYFFSIAIKLNGVPLIYLFMGVTVSAFLSLLPISFLGIGPREASLIFFLGPFVSSEAPLIIFSELILLDYIWVGIFGALMTIFKPIRLKNFL